MRYPNDEIEAFRRNAGELENELIDEYRAGTLSRKELIQRGSVLGMSLPFLGLLAGPAQAAISRPMARPMDVGQRGGTIRIGTASIDASLEPLGPAGSVSGVVLSRDGVLLVGQAR